MKTQIVKITLLFITIILVFISGKAFSQPDPDQMFGKTKAEIVQALRENSNVDNISDGITDDGEYYFIRSLNESESEVHQYYFLTHEIDFCVAIRVRMENRENYKNLEKKWHDDIGASENELNVFEKGGIIMSFDGYEGDGYWQYYYLIGENNSEVINAFKEV